MPPEDYWPEELTMTEEEMEESRRPFKYEPDADDVLERLLEEDQPEWTDCEE